MPITDTIRCMETNRDNNIRIPLGLCKFNIEEALEWVKNHK
jgi:hypothetical protein